MSITRCNCRAVSGSLRGHRRLR